MDGQARPRLLTFGDLLLDVLVAGDFSREYDSAGVVQLYPGGSAAAGKLLLADLRERPLTAEVRVVPGAATGTVLVLRHGEGPGASRMWSHPGASATLAPEDFAPAWFQGLDALHCTGYSFLRPDPRPAAYHALAAARAASPGLLCSLDPNPAHLIADYGPDAFRAMVGALRFDLLLPNAEEGRLLAGADDPATIVTRLLALAPLVALTLGGDGCLLAWGAERRHVPAPPLAPVDATGAGDAFAAGFVTAYCRRRDPVAAAEAGTAAAARVVMRPGAR